MKEPLICPKSWLPNRESVSPAQLTGSKFGGMEASDIRRMRELEEENRQLKRMYADLSLDHRVLKDVLEKKPWERVKGGR
jgi:hypothetical protein